MNKYSNEFKEKIIKECLETNTKKPIAKKYNIPLTTLCHWINNHQASKVKGAGYSDEIKREVIEEYRQGQTITELVKKYGIIEGTINSWIKPYARKRGVKSLVEQEDYFDNIDTEEKSYYLGWLMADGNVSIYNGQYSLKIHIQLSDRIMIDRFVQSIGCSNSIVEKESYNKNKCKYYESCYISITSVHMVKSLMKLGIVPNKTGLERIPDIPYHLIPHFLRGFFDGDGIASLTNKTRFIGFISNNEMLEQIRRHIGFAGKVSPAVQCKTPGIGTLGTSSIKKIKEIYTYLYSDCHICLERKRNVFEAILNGNTEVNN